MTCRSFTIVIGTIPTDAKLLYATSQGNADSLRRSRAMQEYERVAEFLMEHGCQRRN